MELVKQAHNRVFRRRVRRLADLLAPLLPSGASVLDLGCGDGSLGHLIGQRRPDLEIQGMDVLPRAQTHIPVALFDGHAIPRADASFDAVLLVDVLHHADDPRALLREVTRVCRQRVVIKDHTREGWLAGPTLRFMDWVGNARYGVALPYQYWALREWRETFAALGLTVEFWKTDLGLYPPPAHLIFERSLHFIAQLSPTRTATDREVAGANGPGREGDTAP